MCYKQKGPQKRSGNDVSDDFRWVVKEDLSEEVAFVR